MSNPLDGGGKHVVRHFQIALVEVAIWNVPNGTDRDWHYNGKEKTDKIYCDCGESFDSEEEAIEHLEDVDVQDDR